MNPQLQAQLQRHTERLAELDFLLARPEILADMKQYRPLAREHAQVKAVTQRWQHWQRWAARAADAQAILSDAATAAELGEEMCALAEEEAQQASAAMARLEATLRRLLIPSDPDDARAAFLEIRAGTGGDESALFAADLARMYTRWAQTRGWRVEVMNAHDSDLGGYKEVILKIEDPQAASLAQASDALDDDGGSSTTAALPTGVYGLLRFESGGHRVQRVPATETQGRIHTSAATVAVMPEPDPDAAITLNPADLRIDTFRASGAGGQHINKTDSAVRVVHLPTGIVAECQDGRSQHANKARALQVLQARLEEKSRRERESKEAALRKGLIGSGDRSDRIRTYNFPQGRLSDHRINLTLYKLGQIMDGDLDELLENLRQSHEAELLAELGI